MLYLGTSPCEPDVALLLDQHRIGLMCQPGSNKPRVGWLWAADNGCFAEAWRFDRWFKWLRMSHPRSGCLFAVVPDVVADHEATLKRWAEYAWAVGDAGYPLAFVGQNGATIDTIPWDEFDTFFVGGDDDFKMGAAFPLAEEARRRGKWVHVGRVNSNIRYRAWQPFADSCDGTLLAFGPKTNLPRITSWLENAERQPTIWSTP
jgi:hypothetical protein